MVRRLALCSIYLTRCHRCFKTRKPRLHVRKKTSVGSIIFLTIQKVLIEEVDIILVIVLVVMYLRYLGVINLSGRLARLLLTAIVYTVLGLREVCVCPKMLLRGWL